MKNTNKKEDNKLEAVLMTFRHAMTTSLLEEAKETGFSLSHLEVIMYVAEKRRVTMKNIASFLHITPPSASVIVDTLVSKGLVERVKSDKDRRTIHIELGKKGHEIFYSIHKKKVSVFKKMLSRLNEEDKEELSRILIKCIHN